MTSQAGAPADPIMAQPTPDQLLHAPSLEDLYPLLGGMSVGAGWNKPTPSLWAAPKRNFHPAHWSYAQGKAALTAAGRLINTELAERRNLILVNPVDGNDYATVRTIVAAYQMIMPGEWARAHRHTPNALRLILDTEPGTYTIVAGQSIDMSPGDVLLTPNWSSHGHGNKGKAPGYWLDFLDVPLVQLLESMFFDPQALDEAEHEPAGRPPKLRADRPMVFPIAETRRRLREQDADPAGSHGNEIELGDPALETLGLHMMQLRSGVPTRLHQTTANNIFAVVEGSGVTTIDRETFRWKRGDVIAAPAWRAYTHLASEDSLLFRVSDEPTLEKLGLLRVAKSPQPA